MTWDNTLTASSVTLQDSNAPAFKGAGGLTTDKDSGVDVSLFDQTAGNWVTEDPTSNAYLPTGSGYAITNYHFSISSGPSGTMMNIGNLGSRRQRIVIVVTQQGFFRCMPHVKDT